MTPNMWRVCGEYLNNSECRKWEKEKNLKIYLKSQAQTL